jgi:hypothetical protein
MAKFQKGQSGNTKGKPKGAVSQKTKFFNEMADWFTQEGAERFIEEMKKLKGQQYVMAYSNALEFFKPKLSRAEHKVELPGAKIVIDIPDKE